MNILRKITTIYLGFLSIILPLKFGTLAMMPEATCYFPSEMWEYILVNFPSAALGIFGGVGMLLSMIAFGGEFFRKKICFNWTVFAWIAAAFLSISGFANASTMDYPIMAIAHIASFLSYAFSIYIYCQTNENALQKILSWWTVGLMLVLASGLYQYFWGFDDQLAFYYSESGQAANVDNLNLSSKMTERRIFATFSGCNVLAGFLLLASALGFYVMYQWGGNFQPPKQSRILFCGILAAAVLFVLINTGSRGAVAAVGGTLIYTLFWLKIKTKYKIAGASLIVLGIVGLIMLSVFFGRTFGSFTERLGYWRTAFLMMVENWPLGSGWGDFFVDNMRFRIIDLEETARSPHNLFLVFGCSCGVFAMLSVMFASAWGLFQASMKFYREKNLLNCAVMVSIAAFLVHAMLDVNFQIAASMGIFCTLTIIAAENENVKDNRAGKIAFFIACSVILLVAIAYSHRLIVGEKAFDKLKNEIHMALRENKFTEWEIMQSYQKVEEYRPYSPFHALDMYHYFFARRMYNEALPYLEKAIERSPERAGYYYYRAMHMVKVGKLDHALHDIEIAQEMYPNSKKYRTFEENLKKSLKNQ